MTSVAQQNAAYSEQFDLPPISGTAGKLRSCAKEIVPLHERVLAFISILVCGAALWFLASETARMDSMNHEVSRLQAEVQRVQADNTSLAAQVDSLAKPTNILSVAVSQLHMQFTKPVTIAELSSEGRP